MKCYRACALFLSLVVVTLAVALFSPGTGAASTGHAVLMRLAQGSAADAEARTALHNDAADRAPKDKEQGRGVVAGKPFTAALSAKPLGNTKPAAEGGGRGVPIPEGLNPASPVEGAGGEGGGWSANGGGSAGGSGSEQAASGDEPGNGAAGSGQAAADASRLAEVLAAYHSRIASLIEAQKRYPEIARRLKHEGMARVRFRLSAEGQLLTSAVDTGSGFAELDEAALNAVRRVAKFPAFPHPLGAGDREFVVTLNFTLK